MECLWNREEKKEPLVIFPPWALREEEELNKIHSIKLMKKLNKKIMSWDFYSKIAISF